MVSEKGWCDKIGYGTNELTLYPVEIYLGHSEGVQYYSNIYDWTIIEPDPNEDYILPGVKIYDKDTHEELVGYTVKQHPLIGYDQWQLYNADNEFLIDVASPSYWPGGEITVPTGGEFQPTTYFKVPKLSSYIIQKENIPVVGNGMTVGMTDGTKNGGLEREFTNNTGSFFRFSEGTYGTQVGSTTTTAPNLGAKTIGITTDPTKSGMIADTSDVATTERVMIQLFNGSTDTALATCTEVLSDVAGLKQTTDGMIDYVVESQLPTEENNYSWYRLYKSGWVEQGKFRNSMDANVNTTCMLIIPMKDTNYFITGVYDTNTSAINSLSRIGVGAKTTQSFQMVTEGGQYSWEVKGFSNITN